jgi:hypothetical protein
VRVGAHPYYKELEMLHPPLPQEVRTVLDLRHHIQADLLAVQEIRDVLDDLPDGACYLPLGPRAVDPSRSHDLSYKDGFDLLMQTFEYYVLDDYHQVNQQLGELRKKYPNYNF